MNDVLRNTNEKTFETPRHNGSNDSSESDTAPRTVDMSKEVIEQLDKTIEAHDEVIENLENLK